MGCDGVPFVECADEWLFVARLRQGQPEPERTRVRKGDKSHRVDPKPGELSMGRVKRAEHARGGPNPDRLQTIGMTCG
jgi:hypothetical protein